LPNSLSIHTFQDSFTSKAAYKGQITLGKNGLPTSTRTGHGTGTRSIMAFCEKHNAFYDFSTEGGWFKLMITL